MNPKTDHEILIAAPMSEGTIVQFEAMVMYAIAKNYGTFPFNHDELRLLMAEIRNHRKAIAATAPKPQGEKL